LPPDIRLGVEAVDSHCFGDPGGLLDPVHRGLAHINPELRLTVEAVRPDIRLVIVRQAAAECQVLVGVQAKGHHSRHHAGMSFRWVQGDRQLMGLVIVAIHVGDGDAEFVDGWLGGHRVLLLALAGALVDGLVVRPGLVAVAQVALKQIKQASPMPLCAWLVIDLASIRKGKTVFRAGIPLDAILDIAGFQMGFERINDFPGCIVIYLGTGEIHFALDLVRAQVRRVIPFGHEVGAVDGGRALNPIRKMGGCSEHEGPAHAVTDGANFLGIGLGVSLEEIEQCLGIFHNQLDAQVAGHLHHVLHAGFCALKDKLPSLAVIEVGEYHIVADSGDSPRHIVQLLPFARRIHIEHHDGKGATFVRMSNEGIHGAVLGLDIDMVFYHCVLALIRVALPVTVLLADKGHASALACSYQYLLMHLLVNKVCQRHKNAMLMSLVQVSLVQVSLVQVSLIQNDKAALKMLDYPILYSFRRCPYAMRARLALSAAGVTVRLREVALKHKPDALLLVSAKATVPVLVLPNATVIDESLDILHWALAQQDPAGWLRTDVQKMARMKALVEENDQVFKGHLDRYKYADHDAMDVALAARDECEVFLHRLDRCLRDTPYLFDDRVSYADMAILPFVRQFAHVDLAWFRTRRYTT